MAELPSKVVRLNLAGFSLLSAATLVLVTGVGARSSVLKGNDKALVELCFDDPFPNTMFKEAFGLCMQLWSKSLELQKEENCTQAACDRAFSSLVEMATELHGLISQVLVAAEKSIYSNDIAYMIASIESSSSIFRSSCAARSDLTCTVIENLLERVTEKLKRLDELRNGQHEKA